MTEAHLDYIYRGGYNVNDHPKTGILYDKKHNHYKFGNILFIDGSAKGFYGEDWQKNIDPNKKDAPAKSETSASFNPNQAK